MNTNELFFAEVEVYENITQTTNDDAQPGHVPVGFC
jgi:hypothetical protein